MVELERGEITQLLSRSAEGDPKAREALWEQVHGALRGLARRRLDREQGVLTWQPTELVSEMWIKLDGLRLVPNNRQHFFALAASAMRQVLIDEARARRRDKRGGGQPALTLDPGWVDDSAQQPVDLLDLDRALTELAQLSPRKAQAVELSYFAGVSDAELAELLEVSPATAKRELRAARAWLASTLAISP